MEGYFKNFKFNGRAVFRRKRAMDWWFYSRLFVFKKITTVIIYQN
jgi:hypothetical protein